MSLENESRVLLETSVESVDNVDVVDNHQEPSTPAIVTEQVSLPISLPSELCTLCMDTRNDPVTLTCSDHHTFCRKCLLQTGPPKCPMCRAPYKYTDLWNDDLYDPENEFHVQFKHALDTFGRAIINVTTERDFQERIRYEEELTRQRFLSNPIFENTLERRLNFLSSTVARQPEHIIRAFADRLGVPLHEDNDWEEIMDALRGYLGYEDATIPTDVYQDAAYELMTHTENNAYTNLSPNTVAGLQAQLMAAFPGARITRVTPDQFHTVGGNPMPGMPGFNVNGATFYNYEDSDDDENNNQNGNEENQHPNEPLRLTAVHNVSDILRHLIDACHRQQVARDPNSIHDFLVSIDASFRNAHPVVIASPSIWKNFFRHVNGIWLGILIRTVLKCLSRESLDSIIRALVAAGRIQEDNPVFNVHTPSDFLSDILVSLTRNVNPIIISRFFEECVDNETIRDVLRTDPYSPLRIEDETDETVPIPPSSRSSDPFRNFVPVARIDAFVNQRPNAVPDPIEPLPISVNDTRVDPTPQTESRMRPWYLDLLRTSSEFESENGAKFIIWIVLGIVSVCFPWTLAKQQSMDDRNRSITYLLAFGIHQIVAIANFLVVATYFAFLYQFYMVGISFGVLWLAIKYLHTISIRTLVAFQRYYRGNEFFNTNPTNCITKVKHYFSRI